jgi:hypothetical protein
MSYENALILKLLGFVWLGVFGGEGRGEVKEYY